MGFLQINHASTITTAAIMVLLLVATAVQQGEAQPQPAQLGQCLVTCSQRTMACTMQCGAAAVLDAMACMTACGTNSVSCGTGCLGGVNPPAGV
nr:hypothetical protein DM860_006075 [Ipomoea batatas]GMD73689.1 hypothetical protein DM860_006075 [Ipomoea batatas]